MQNQLVMFDEEVQQINGVCQALHKDSNAMAVLVIDKNGQAISAAGEVEQLDVTSLSSLIAGNIAAAGGIANLLSEREFAGQFHEGERTKVTYTVVGGRVILVVLFDERSSLGLVRLRVKRASTLLTGILEELLRKSDATSTSSVLAEITDDDIDNLFND